MITSMLLAMLGVLLTWAVLLFVLCGIGIGLQQLFGARRIDTSRLQLSPWNGFAVVVLLLQIWHFKFAVGGSALAVVAIAAVLGLWCARRELAAWIGSERRVGWRLPLALALAAIWLANRAIGPGDALDSGVYHYQAVRWAHEHPIAVGLANLYPLFALNNACHLFVAMLQVGWWQGRANHLANGLLLLIWFCTSLISAARLWRGRGPAAQNIFNLVALIPLVMYAVSKEASSPTTDLPAAALTLAAGSAFVRLLSARAEDADDDDPADTALSTLSVVLLGTAALCVKLTAAATVVPMGLLAMAVFLVRRPPRRWAWATLLWGCGLSAALTGTWVARNVVMSGCPFFPSRALSPDVSWRVSPYMWSGMGTDLHTAGEQVRVGMLDRALRSPQLAKLPASVGNRARAVLQSANDETKWVIALLFASTIEVALPVLLSVLALLALGLRHMWYDADAKYSARAIDWLVCVPPIIGVIAWFLLSPEPRYIAASLWLLAAGLLAIRGRDTAHPSRWIITVLVLAMLPVGYRALVLKLNPRSGPVSSAFVIAPGADHGLHPIPTVAVIPYRAQWGLVVWTTIEHAPPWDAPLPASGSLNPGVMLREPGKLESGFVISTSLDPSSDLARERPPKNQVP